MVLRAAGRCGGSVNGKVAVLTVAELTAGAGGAGSI